MRRRAHHHHRKGRPAIRLGRGRGRGRGDASPTDDAQAAVDDEESVGRAPEATSAQVLTLGPCVAHIRCGGRPTTSAAQRALHQLAPAADGCSIAACSRLAGQSRLAAPLPPRLAGEQQARTGVTSARRSPALLRAQFEPERGRSPAGRLPSARPLAAEPYLGRHTRCRPFGPLDEPGRRECARRVRLGPISRLPRSLETPQVRLWCLARWCTQASRGLKCVTSVGLFEGDAFTIL
mmetsp:Transcript_8668/g.28558  ORF Transcript_8668/g.28558 Transcript_8668/m.28558 type:complete len:236 (+) Transcript_8668:1501-2208(+)